MTIRTCSRLTNSTEKCRVKWSFSKISTMWEIWKLFTCLVSVKYLWWNLLYDPIQTWKGGLPANHSVRHIRDSDAAWIIDLWMKWTSPNFSISVSDVDIVFTYNVEHHILHQKSNVQILTGIKRPTIKKSCKYNTILYRSRVFGNEINPSKYSCISHGAAQDFLSGAVEIWLLT